MDYKGAKYDSSTPITQIARNIRADIKTEKSLPDSVLASCPKISVTVQRYSMGQAINIEIRQCQVNPINPHFRGDYENESKFSPDGLEILEILKAITSAYNKADGDRRHFFETLDFSAEIWDAPEACQKCGQLLSECENPVCEDCRVAILFRNFGPARMPVPVEAPARNSETVENILAELKTRGVDIASLLTGAEFAKEAEKRGYVLTESPVINSRTCPVRTVPSGLWETWADGTVFEAERFTYYEEYSEKIIFGQVRCCFPVEIRQCTGIKILSEVLKSEHEKLSLIAKNGGYIACSGNMDDETMKAVESLIAWRVTALEDELWNLGFEGSFSCMRRGDSVLRTTFTEYGIHITGYAINGVADDFTESTADFARHVIRGNDSRSCPVRSVPSGQAIPEIPTEELIRALLRRIPNLADLVSEDEFDEAARERGYVRKCRVCDQPEDDNGLCADCLDVFMVDCGYDCRDRGYYPQAEYEAMYA